LNASMPEVPVGDWAGEFEPFRNDHLPQTQVGHVRADILQRARAGYYGHMTHIDHQLDRFVESLAYFKVHKNTVICFVSDHGELMGDHHLFRKTLAYEGSARVPLIFWGGAQHCAGIQTGKVFNQPVELRDIMPTLLDLAGLEVPTSVEGKSVAPMLRGEKQDGEGWRVYVHGEHVSNGGSSQYLTDGKEKFVWLSWNGHEQFFDLQRDPQELHDLARDPACAARLTKWRDRLVKELTGREEGFVADGKLTVKKAVPPVMSHILQRTVMA